MGSVSDWKTMVKGAELLKELQVRHDVRVVSAHRTPERLHAYATALGQQGEKVVIAAAGGSAHLAGMVAAYTCLPVIGVPMVSSFQDGLDSLLSMVNMPAGVPVATMAVGEAGATNAALLAAAIVALSDEPLKQRLQAWRQKQTDNVALRPPQ
ncbi:MAG: 5-(carboxyamino)imidazole ribonucleotide mutase [Alphaproteobacteria bacterium GM202ARS2]|nr:5-(carboxyamino)imidazole ribonucleotide mutase [Alphaproteobacteria bacterium GM202ARS2]